MRKNNVRVTRPEQDRATAAIARRAKRKAARDAIIAPYLKLRRAAATQPGPTELAAAEVGNVSTV